MKSDYFSLAFGNLKHRGLRSWLTILGIFIGIAAVVALISLGDGLRNAITGQFSNLDPDILVVQNAETGFGPPGSTAAKKLNENDLDIIKKVPDVDLVVSRLIRVASVNYNKITRYSYLGSLPSDERQVDLIYDQLKIGVEKGSLLKAGEKGKVVLGNDFLKTKEFEKDIRIGTKINIQGKDFEVIGILKPGSSFIINGAILMNEDDMKEILKIRDEIDLIVVKISNENKVEQVAENIKEKLRRDRHEKKGEEDFSVQTPIQSLQAINTVLNIVNLIVSGIAAVSLLIGGIGIANIMYTSVLERKKEIGIMKAIGAKNSDIMHVFLIESGFLGLVGGVLGAAFGLGLAFLVASGANTALPGLNFKIAISYPLLFLAVGFSFLMGILSGLLPAKQASQLKPVDALRG